MHDPHVHAIRFSLSPVRFHFHTILCLQLHLNLDSLSGREFRFIYDLLCCELRLAARSRAQAFHLVDYLCSSFVPTLR